MTLAGLSRGIGIAGVLALVLAPVAAEAQAAPVCPDATTIEAARLVEFQTMMMGVAVRCRYLGVPIIDHLDGMNSTRRLTFAGANDRVATFLRSLTPTLAPSAGAPPAGGANTQPLLTPAAPAKPVPKQVTKLAPAPVPATPATRAKARRAPARAVTAAPAPARPPAAKISRRNDPFDRYLTMIGNQYGAGTTTMERCKAFDTIVLSIADKASTDRLLTMVTSALVRVTLLEAIVNCRPKK